MNLANVYKWLVPPFCALLICATVGNILIVVTARWLKKGISTNLYLCLSLAAVDAWAALLAAIQLYAQHILVNKNNANALSCWFLVMNVLRMGAMFSSMFHLLAIAVNQLITVVYPLHSKVFWTPRKSLFLCFNLWLAPLVFQTGWNVLISGDGFRSASSCTIKYAQNLPYHLLVASLVIIPFLMTIVVYALILNTLGRRRQSDAFVQSNRYLAIVVGQPPHRRSRSVQLVCSQQRNNLSAIGHLEDVASREGTTPSNQTVMYKAASPRLHGRRRGSVGTGIDRRAINTALIIVGSFACSWVPSAAFFMIVCDGGCILTIKESFDYPTLLFAMDVITHALLFLKWFSNPFLYAMRIRDVKVAWRNMRRQCTDSAIVRHPFGYQMLLSCCGGHLAPARGDGDSTMAKSNLSHLHHRRSDDDAAVANTMPLLGIRFDAAVPSAPPIRVNFNAVDATVIDGHLATADIFPPRRNTFDVNRH